MCFNFYLLFFTRHLKSLQFAIINICISINSLSQQLACFAYMTPSHVYISSFFSLFFLSFKDHTVTKFYEICIFVCRNLQVLRENFDPASGMTLVTSPHRRQGSSSSWCSGLLASSSVLDIAAASQHLSECLSQRLLGTTVPPGANEIFRGLRGLESCTPAEKRARKVRQ